MTIFNDFEPIPEYLCYQSLIRQGFIRNDNYSDDWNNENSDFHKFYADFMDSLDKIGHKIERRRFN